MLTPQDRELRKTRIGASEIGALLEVDPYKTKIDLFTDKTTEEADDGKDHQRWGLDQEQSIIAYHARAKRYDLIAPVDDHGQPTPDGKWRSVAHPTLPLVCTTDALAISKDGTVAIQAKNDQGWGDMEWGKPGTDDAPLLYIAQCTVEIGVLLARGREVVRDDLAVSVRGAPPVGYPIRFDPELFGQLGELALRFKRDHLDTGKRPDGEPAKVAEYIKRRYSQPMPKLLLQETPELLALVAKVKWFRSQTKALKAEALAAENELKAAIGEAEGIAGLCTWKLQKGSTYEVTKKSGRVLRITGLKEED